MDATRIERDPAAAGRERFDLIVVGGGVYGVALALEAARRGLRPLLLERHDFGGATSWNSHRIVHGGLRYLQGLDLARFRESVAERSWFLRHFPDLVEPLPCLMPLYGRGARRPAVLRLGLLADHLLSRHRNRGLPPERRLEAGRVLSAAETVELFPGVARDGLRGGALWYDAVMLSSQRLLVEMLRWACAAGATCLNYVEALDLRTDGGGVRGVVAIDHETGVEIEPRATLVVNCAGPWSRRLAASFDRDLPRLFRPSLAFNLLLDEPPLATPAVAVSPPDPEGHTYFLYGRHGRLYAGTGHAPWQGGGRPPRPTEAQIGAFLDDLERAVPALELHRGSVVRVYAGLLPTRSEGSSELAVRPEIHDHGASGGPKGAWSVSGVKFTTARRVAEQTLRRLFPTRRLAPDRTIPRPAPRPLPDVTALRDWLTRGADDDGAPGPGGPQRDGPVRKPTDDDPLRLGPALRAMANEEAALHLDDLLLRRTDWGEDPALARRLAPLVCRLRGWDDDRTRQETARLEADLQTAAASLDQLPEGHRWLPR